MDLTPYVNDFGQRFAAAAEASGPEAWSLAERLTSVLDSAIRLLLLSVLSDATVEISRDLAPGSVEIRLRGLDPDFAVTPPPGDREFAEPPLSGSGASSGAGFAASPPGPAEPDSDEGGTWRINLRLPAHLKPRIEEAASREGVSANTWLARAASAALDSGDRDRRSSRWGGWSGSGGQRYTGWVR